MSLDFILDFIITIAFIPLQVIFFPLDLLLSAIDGLEAIPQAITAISVYIGTLPQTLVYLIGVQPIIWNVMFSTFITYMLMSPAVQVFKKVWAWVRP